MKMMLHSIHTKIAIYKRNSNLRKDIDFVRITFSDKLEKEPFIYRIHICNLENFI